MVVVLFLRGMVVILGGVDDRGFSDVRGRRTVGKGLYNMGWEKWKSFFALQSSLSNQNSIGEDLRCGRKVGINAWTTGDTMCQLPKLALPSDDRAKPQPLLKPSCSHQAIPLGLTICKCHQMRKYISIIPHYNSSSNDTEKDTRLMLKRRQNP